MNRLRLIAIFQVILCIALVQVEKVDSDRSDEICRGVHPGPVISSKCSLPRVSNEISDDMRAQKSLLIVFDGTESMGDDLKQMVPAAKQIIERFNDRKKKPIRNFVLTVFQDPSMRLID